MNFYNTKTQFFQQCKDKLKMYLETGKQLKSTVWECLLAFKNGDDIQFYDGCDLIVEISGGHTFEQNLDFAVIWLLEGQKDPLAEFRK